MQRPTQYKQSPLLYRKSYKVRWKFKPGPDAPSTVYRSDRAGPNVKSYECKTH
jgi:hypothetical protein